WGLESRFPLGFAVSYSPVWHVIGHRVGSLPGTFDLHLSDLAQQLVQSAQSRDEFSVQRVRLQTMTPMPLPRISTARSVSSPGSEMIASVASFRKRGIHPRAHRRCLPRSDASSRESNSQTA